MGWPFIFLKSAWFFCSTLLYNLKLLDILKAKVFIAHSCPTLCNPMDCSPPGSSGHGDSPGKNTGLGCHFLIQGIFPIQGSNLVFLHCRQILYRLSHQGSSHDPAIPLLGEPPLYLFIYLKIFWGRGDVDHSSLLTLFQYCFCFMVFFFFFG